MPHRRPVKRGSFGGHFDELVKHFVPGRSHPVPLAKRRKSKAKAKSAASINQKLFERAIH
jgi:hypothetical protein